LEKKKRPPPKSRIFWSGWAAGQNRGNILDFFENKQVQVIVLGGEN
jgi:hypothetical protein